MLNACTCYRPSVCRSTFKFQYANACNFSDFQPFTCLLVSFNVNTKHTLPFFLLPCSVPWLHNYYLYKPIIINNLIIYPGFRVLVFITVLVFVYGLYTKFSYIKLQVEWQNKRCKTHCRKARKCGERRKVYNKTQQFTN